MEESIYNNIYTLTYKIKIALVKATNIHSKYTMLDLSAHATQYIMICKDNKKVTSTQMRLISLGKESFYLIKPSK